ncbi:uncharacterized protein GIQ15_02525 [Arthroderma uncinatum]|uniref:uncharacterized protein n=1 Tax=Arthroderma uncinatum TaxID=74035 RepID=UPI00144A5935|nr:uncharacterized protein GIQ15_02525 [Arthroderma uncinatum]KAF3483201.1 hypothetical protein GIQ15_02525 [Arthroderma uncinatum]
MTCFRPFFSAAQALRSTFIASIEPQAIQTTKQLYALPTRQLRFHQSSSAPRTVRPIRITYGTFPPSSPTPYPKPYSPAPRSSTPSPKSSSASSARPRTFRDEEIPSQTVIVVQENGELGTPISLKEALTQFDRSINCLVQVRAATEDQPPICKVMAIADQNKGVEKNKGARKAKSTSVQIKQIELNWAIDPHDLKHRLNQLETFLAKGKRVTLVLTKKARKRRATLEEANRLLASVEEKLFEIGVTEVKPRMGKILQHMEYILDKKKA